MATGMALLSPSVISDIYIPISYRGVIAGLMRKTLMPGISGFCYFSRMIALSAKEQKLLKLICDDYKNAEIADKLEYGTRYVEKLKAALLKKTNTSSNVSLLKWAVLNGHYIIKKTSSIKKAKSQK